MSRIAIRVAVLAVLAAPLGAAATDAPHGLSGGTAGGYNCTTNCHIAHSTGSTAYSGLTTDVNFALCDSCHQNFPGTAWVDTQQATYAGTVGISHNWSNSASGGGAIAPDPGNTTTLIKVMGQHLDAGNLKCSTCHDVHKAPNFATSTLHSSLGSTTVAQNIPLLTGTVAQLLAFPPGATPTAAGYLIKATASNAFKVSFDSGVHWWGYLSGKWDWDTHTAPVNYSGGKSTGTNIALPDPPLAGTTVALDSTVTKVTLTSLTGTFPVVSGKFFLSYPFTRGDPGTMCISCHKDRNQSSANVEGTPGTLKGNGATISLGTTVFHHPVGQPLAQTYDRSGGTFPLGNVLDADGAPQSAPTDGNTTNDLPTDSSGNVTCMTCHHPHNADSNSLSVDPR